MAKKKSSNLLTLVPFILGLVAIASMFLVCITLEGADGGYSGWQAIFGYSESAGFVTLEILGFSIMNLIGLLLVVSGTLFVLLGSLGKSGKFANLISTIAFIAGGIFIFLMPTFTITITDSLFKASWILGGGAIIGAVASVLAGLACAYKLIKK